MQQRLALHIGKALKVYAETYTSEIGTLTKVYRQNWFKMNGVNFVSHAANQIQMIGTPVPLSAPTVLVRTTFDDDIFEARYICKGPDYVEIARVLLPESQVMLIPMDKVIGLQFT